MPRTETGKRLGASPDIQADLIGGPTVADIDAIEAEAAALGAAEERERLRHEAASLRLRYIRGQVHFVSETALNYIDAMLSEPQS